MRVVLQNVRLSFPELFKAKQFVRNGKPEGDPAFSASFIMPKNHPNMKELKAAIKEVAVAKWGAKADVTLKAIEAKDFCCLHDGDLKDYDGYADNMYVSARNKTRPTVLDTKANGDAPLTAEDGKPYAGCYVHAIIEIWADDSNKRVNASLCGVKFYKDGDAFTGGGTAKADEYADVEEEGEDDVSKMAS